MVDENESFCTVFSNEWNKAVKRLKESGVDLSKIPIVCKEGMWSDTRANKRSSENNHRRAY